MTFSLPACKVQSISAPTLEKFLSRWRVFSFPALVAFKKQKSSCTNIYSSAELR